MLACLNLGCESWGSHGTPTTQQVERSQGKLDELPPPAKLAALRESEGGLIRKVSTGEFEGHALYTIEFTTLEGSKGRLQTLSDGRVLSKEIDQRKISATALPPEVSRAISTHTGGIAPSGILLAKWGDSDVYVVTAELSGKTHQFTFDGRGQLLREQAEIDTAQLPVRSRATLLERFPSLKIRTVSEIRIGGAVFFEVVGDTETAHLTVTLLPGGTIKSVKTE
jgi:hypothetical protein